MFAFILLWACSAQKDVVFDFDDPTPQSTNQPETTQPEDTPADTEEPPDSEPEASQPESQPEAQPESQPDPAELCDSESTGTEIGECASNFALMNESDSLVELYDYQGDVIFLDLSSFTWGACRSSGPSFNQFYLDNRDKGLTSIVAVHDASPNDLNTWRMNYGSDVVLLLDNTSSVYNTFKLDNSRPQYVVMDQGMNILLKGKGSNGKQQAEALILELLTNQ